jgi:hypothetical protein
MSTQTGLQAKSFDELHCEIVRYLEAVDAFRAEGCEPSWRSEGALPQAPISAVLAPSASICA